MRKTTIAIPHDICESARAEADRRGVSLLDFVADALCKEMGAVYDKIAPVRAKHRVPPELMARAAEMKRLRFEQKWSLQTIADKYGLTRERVRQIVGNSGETFVNAPEKQIILENPDMTTEELSSIVDLPMETVRRYRQGTRYKIGGDSNAAVGAAWEEWASDRLEEMGHSVKLMPYGSKYDLLVDGASRIDVKVSIAPRDYPSMRGMVNPSWSFNTKKDRIDLDFYMVILAPTKDVFVIPADQVPSGRNYRGTVRFVWPTNRPELGKYQRFHGRYDLIASADAGDRPSRADRLVFAL